MQVRYSCKLGTFDTKRCQFSSVASLSHWASNLLVYSTFAVMQHVARICQRLLILVQYHRRYTRIYSVWLDGVALLWPPCVADADIIFFVPFLSFFLLLILLLLLFLSLPLPLPLPPHPPSFFFFFFLFLLLLGPKESCVRWDSTSAEGGFHGTQFWYASIGYNFGCMSDS